MPKARQRPLPAGEITASATSSGPWRNVVVLLLLQCLLTLHLCDACAQGEFRNVSGSCQQCTDCGRLRHRPVRACNGTADSVCEPCPNPNHYYANELQRCTLDCTSCPQRVCAEGMTDQCDCSFDRCATGVMCEQRSGDSACVVPCAQGEFRNVSAGKCQQCTDCGRLRLRPVRPCNGTVDSVCEPCRDPNEYYNNAVQRCTLDCTSCPRGRCVEGNEDQCDCSFNRCATGRMCDRRSEAPGCPPTVPTTASTTGAAVTPQDDSPVFLPHWGIALVSVGVIVGIILFSALFVLLGLATTHRKGRHEDFSSSNTTNSSLKCSSIADKLSYSTGRHSTSLMSLYTQSNSPAFQNYLLSLSALKTNSHGNLESSWNNLKNSPKTERSSSVPVTTVNKSRDGFWTPV